LFADKGLLKALNGRKHGKKEKRGSLNATATAAFPLRVPFQPLSIALKIVDG